jgi:dihydropteroate synthase
MGIINTTFDSFSGDGLAGELDRTVALARRMVVDGADLLDVGAESTRPGARPVPEEEELERAVSTVEAIARAVEVPISIDTRRTRVAEAALQAGAGLVNDVNGLQREPELAAVAARFQVPLIAVHSPGESWSVTWPARYVDVVDEVKSVLARAIEVAIAAGIPADQVVVDPGFGFGKGPADNLTLVRRLGELRTLGCPVLLGASRKQTIGRVLGLPVEDRLEGSLALVALGIAQGVDLVRVHDVRESVRVARLADAVVRANWLDQ